MPRPEKPGEKDERKSPKAAKLAESDLEPLKHAEIEHLSALQLCDVIRMRLQYLGVDGQDLRLLRDRVAEMEEIQDQARGAIEKLTTAVEKLRAPALRLGTLIQRVGEDRGLVCVGGSEKCGSQCVDTDTNPTNCGGCGVTCPPGDACSLGSCWTRAMSTGSGRGSARSDHSLTA